MHAQRQSKVSATLSKLTGTIILLLTGIWAVGCGQPTAPPSARPTVDPPPQHVWIGIEDSAKPLADLIAADYQAAVAPNVIVHTVLGNGQTLISDLEDGQLDLVLTHVVPTGFDGWFNPVAIDGLAIIVSSQNQISSGLTSTQLRSLFSGRQASWAAISGQEAPVTLYVRESGSSGRAILQDRLMAESRVAITAVTVGSDLALQQAVEADPHSLGYTMMGNLGAYASESEMGTAIGVDGLLPTPNTVGTQQYLLTTPVYAVTSDEPFGPTRDLVAWLQSAETQAQLGDIYGRVR